MRRVVAPAVIALIAAGAAMPTVAYGQALYADGSGLIVTASPLEAVPSHSDHTLFLFGLGVRIGDSVDLTVRAGRFEDVPRGNPLPITYIGHTYASATLARVLPAEDGDSGMMLRLQPGIVVADRSFPVSNLPDPVTFREGRSVSDLTIGGDVQRYWRREVSPTVTAYLLAGARADYIRRRNGFLQHSDGQVGTMHGGSTFIPALSGAVPVAFSFDDRRRLVVEPWIHLRPGYYFIPWPHVGLSVHLNL